MTWDEFVSKIDWFDSSDTWGGPGALDVISPLFSSNPTLDAPLAQERAAILGYLNSLFTSSPLARAALEEAASDPRGLRIAHSLVGPGFADHNKNLIALDIYGAADTYYVNQTGELVREDVRVTAIHEVIHLIKNQGDLPVAPTSPESGYDAYLNGANADHRGPIVYDASSLPGGLDQGDVQAQLGIAHRQMGYIASVEQAETRYGLLASTRTMLGTDSFTFTDGGEIDIARFGDITGTNQDNNIDHTARTTLLRDLVFGFGGADTIKTGAGDDYVYGGAGSDTIEGGAGNDVLYGEGDNDPLIDGGSGDDFLDGGAGTNTMDGGAGSDTVSFRSLTSGVELNATSSTLTHNAGANTISSIESVLLTDQVDEADLDDAPGLVATLGGADVINITPRTEHDLIFIAPGDEGDTISFSEAIFTHNMAAILGGDAADQLIYDGYNIANLIGEANYTAQSSDGYTWQITDGSGHPTQALYVSWGVGGDGELGFAAEGSVIIDYIDSRSGTPQGIEVYVFGFQSGDFGINAPLVPVFDGDSVRAGLVDLAGFASAAAVSAAVQSDHIWNWIGIGSWVGSAGATSSADTFAGVAAGDVAKGLGGADTIKGAGGDDALHGDDGNDELDGGTGADQLLGGAGHDTLKGGAGVDKLDGGAGDDVVFWDAGDDLANVTGGADTDVLVFTSGAAPTTFDLSARGFESAEARFTDESFQAWETLTEVYDTLWRLDHSTLVNDDDSYATTNFDQANAASWSSYWQHFDALARVEESVLLYDNGVSESANHDAADDFDWTQFWWQEDALERRTESVLVYDDGTEDSINYDAADAFAWDTFYWQEDPLGRRTESVLVNDDSSRDSINYDAADAFAWEDFWWRQDTLGRRTEDILTYDDGSRDVKDYDETASFTWASIWRHYNPSGVLTQTITTYDDGSVVIV